jgi:hypothetical protein
VITTDEHNNVNEQQIKEYHRKRLLELSIKKLGEIPILEEPNFEEKEFMKRKIFRNDKQ